MNTSRPFTADRDKLAYAQAFTRSATAAHHTRGERPGSLRELAARLHRSGKPSR